MEGLVEFPGDSTRACDFHGDARSRRGSSDDARNDGYGPGSAAALDAGVQTRLQGYGQRDRLTANEKISWAVVTPAYVVKTTINIINAPARANTSCNLGGIAVSLKGTGA